MIAPICEIVPGESASAIHGSPSCRLCWLAQKQLGWVAHSSVKVHPCGDREKIAALTADMVRAFMDGDLDAYWKLDRELRWLLAQGKSKEH